MQVREVRVQNFKGIAELEWKPSSAFCCLLGSGDVGKTTVLDAIEATLSPRWLTFMEADFLDCDASNTMQIDVTIGELSADLKSDDRFGLYVRGWTASNELRDEPIDDDEPVLTVRLTVDATMEPVWELVSERSDRPRILSNRDRSFFGLVRLSGSDTRHLSWGQGSVLARLTDNTEETAARLAGAYRTARDSADFSDIPELIDSANRAEATAKSLGAYVDRGYQPGLELGRSGFSSGSIALHDGGIPLRQAGLGTKRLATLAVQKSGILEGAILLIDEIEHGLEPHRIIGAISQIKRDQKTNADRNKPLGQILMTTHSDVALGEAGAPSLRVLKRDRTTRKMQVLSPSEPSSLKSALRFAPQALLAKRILVLEGRTELGMLLGMKEFWPERHAGVPIEQLGAAIVDGNGSEAPKIALALNQLGFEVGLLRDADNELTAEQIKALETADISVIEYEEKVHTEQALFLAADDTLVQALLGFIHAEWSLEAASASIASKVEGLTELAAREPFSTWGQQSGPDASTLRMILGEVAHKKKWFKEQRIGREVSTLMWRAILLNEGSDLAQTFGKVENWVYG
jgi:predicted ATP-dependent endonuclease of OLD family